MSKNIDVAEFASRVERLCDYLLNKVRDEKAMDGSSDLRVIHDLRNDAADLSLGHGAPVSANLEGLSDFMKGA